jgi:hypothetical protein
MQSCQEKQSGIQQASAVNDSEEKERGNEDEDPPIDVTAQVEDMAPTIHLHWTLVGKHHFTCQKGGIPRQMVDR